jgi:hypothetical protein
MVSLPEILGRQYGPRSAEQEGQGTRGDDEAAGNRKDDRPVRELLRNHQRRFQQVTLQAHLQEVISKFERPVEFPLASEMGRRYASEIRI